VGAPTHDDGHGSPEVRNTYRIDPTETRDAGICRDSFTQGRDTGSQRNGCPAYTRVEEQLTHRFTSA
jgi:hypothetical protein